MFIKKDVPAGLIKNIKEVFESQIAQKMILKEKLLNTKTSKRVKSIAFKINFNTLKGEKYI